MFESIHGNVTSAKKVCWTKSMYASTTLLPASPWLSVLSGVLPVCMSVVYVIRSMCVYASVPVLSCCYYLRVPGRCIRSPHHRLCLVYRPSRANDRRVDLMNRAQALVALTGLPDFLDCCKDFLVGHSGFLDCRGAVLGLQLRSFRKQKAVPVAQSLDLHGMA